MSLLSPAPLRSPLSETPALLPSRPWALWYADLYLRLGGLDVPTLGEMTTALAALTSRVTVLEEQVSDLVSRVEALEGA